MIKTQMIKFNLVAPIVLVFSCMLFLACNTEHVDDCFTNTGPDKTEDRVVDPFHTIELYNNVNLVIKQGNTYKIEVEGGENILSSIKTDVSDSALIIRNTMKCNWVRSYNREVTVIATVPSIREIRYEGSGDVNTENQLLLDSLYVNIRGGAGSFKLNLVVENLTLTLHYGTVDLIVNGTAMNTTIIAGSYGLIDCRDLESNTVLIRNGGSNNSYINVKQKLDYTMYSSGSIYYRGSPSEVFDTISGSGSGRLIRLTN